MNNNYDNNCANACVGAFFKGVLVGIITPWFVSKVIKETVRKVVVENQKKGS